MATPIYSFRTSTYARNIYIFGVTTFDSIPAEYIEPVKQFAAEKYTAEEIKTARDNLWISEQEYIDTMAYKTA